MPDLTFVGRVAAGPFFGKTVNGRNCGYFSVITNSGKLLLCRASHPNGLALLENVEDGSAVMGEGALDEERHTLDIRYLAPDEESWR
jgi:hypothetical protein